MQPPAVTSFIQGKWIRLIRLGILVCLVLGLQAALVFPLLRQTDVNRQATQEAEHLCLQLGRRTRTIHELHLLRPTLDAARASLILQQFHKLMPQLPIEDDGATRQQLLAAMRGQDCSLIERLWQESNRSQPKTGVKHRGDFYALWLRATLNTLDPISDYEYFSQWDQTQVPAQRAYQTLGLIVLDRKDHLLVNRVLPFTAAETEGSIHAGDQILALETADEHMNVADTSIAAFKQSLKTSQEVVLLVRRPAGETGDRTFRVTIKKDPLAAPRAFSYLTTVEGQRIGVIRLPLFYVNYPQRVRGEDYEGAAPDVLKALNTLAEENVAAVLLDLRGNLGGDKDEALRILGYFLGKTLALKIRYADSAPSAYLTLANQVYSGHLGVLIDRLSASASELLAGAIQDYRRGLILGEPSYGKWTVQNVFLFPGFGQEEFSGRLRLTVGETMTPLEHRYPIKGIQPDVSIPSSQGARDTQLSQALEALVHSLDPRLQPQGRD